MGYHDDFYKLAPIDYTDPIYQPDKDDKEVKKYLDALKAREQAAKINKFKFRTRCKICGKEILYSKLKLVPPEICKECSKLK